MTDGSSGVAPYGAQSTRNRETNLDRRTMAYLRRRRKRRKAADAAGFSMLDLGTPVYGWEPGNVAGTIGGGWASGAGTVSRIYDQVVGTARDLVQLSGGAQPAIQEDGGERWARFASGNSMVASGLTLPTICTIQIMVRIAAAGVNADTDAIFVLDNGAGKSLTLQAGDAAEFLADLVGVGTGIASVADFAAADLADDTAHLISIEINQTTDVVSVLIDNQIRAVATGFTGTLDGSWSLTLGGSLDFDFGWAYICSDEYSAAEYASAGAFAESYGATMVSGELTTRFSVAPALTASGGYLVGQDVETDDGTTVNLRDEADSFTYAWRAQAGGLIGGETGDTLTLTIGEEGDEVRSEVANTVLGVAVSGNSAYGDTVSSVTLPSDIAAAVSWYDASDEATISDSGGTVTQWDDKIGSNDITSFSGTPETGNAANDINGVNTINLALNENIGGRAISSLGDTFHLFLVARVDSVNSDAAASLISMNNDGGSGGNVRLTSGDTSYMRGRTFSQGVVMYSQTYASDVNRSATGLWEFAFDSVAETVTAYYNGTQVLQATDYGTGSNGTMDGTSITFYLGRHLASLNPCPSTIGEFVVCDDIVSGSELSNLRAGLLDKWGITP